MKSLLPVVPCLRRVMPTEGLTMFALLAGLAAPVAAQLQFQELPRRSLPANLANDTNAVVLADVDGDGDLDLVRGGGRISLLLNHGGTFTDVTATTMPPRDASALALGDVDGDGDLDIAACTGTGIALFSNNGSGLFTEVIATNLPPDGGNALALGDVDGDGDLDLVVANFGQQNRLYLNNGSGVFTDATAARMPIDSDGTTCLAFGDVDGDGDLDLVFGNSLPAWDVWSSPGGVQNRLYLNDGTGTFLDATATHLPSVVDNTAAVELGDVDGDGDLDLVVGNLGLGVMDPFFPWFVGGEPNRLYLYDGAGAFTDVTATNMPLLGDRTRALALGNVDGDGDLDLIVAESWLGYGAGANYYVEYEQNRLLLNDGTGRFVDATATRMPADLDDTTSLALGDVDGDGDLDVVFGNWPGPSPSDRLDFNLQRQIDAPQAPRIGQTYSLDAYARYGQPSLVDIAVPYLSLATASIPLPPFGTLGIDPTQMLALPPILIPQPAGVGSVSVAVPNDPGLIGLPIYMQALLVPYPLPARLSNVVSDVVVR